jgi:hypothetical protein
MASAAPAKHSNPRHIVQSPADNDHNIAPIANITPTPINTQGLASYSVCGVQGRMARFYSARAVSGRIRLQSAPCP